MSTIRAAPGAVKATPTTPLEHALAYHAAGLAPLPVRRDGSKAPAVASWKRYQQQAPDEAQVRRWWGRPGPPPGVALLCGAASGGLEVIDFDRDADAISPAWQAMVAEAAPGLLDRVSVVATPGGGYHAWFRCGEIQTPGNAKLAALSAAEAEAERALAGREGRKAALTLIETRGEGGYALAPGCPSACHERGGVYERVAGPPLWSVADVSVDERDLLLAMARTFNRADEALPALPPSHAVLPGADLRPGDDLDRNGSWEEILSPHGWVIAGAGPEGELRWRRPGKGIGWSATTGHCTGKDGADLLRVFSFNAAPFEEGKSYGKFRAFALLNTGGDWAQAASLLRRNYGYGAGGGPKAGGGGPACGAATHSAAAPAPPAPPFGPPVPTSALRAIDQAALWLWHGLLSRGGVTLLSALWKAGKTTLLAHLLKSLETGGALCGLETKGARVLYVTEEHESLWAARRERLGLGDHVEWLVRPFATKPREADWLAFLAYVVTACREREYDLLVFDTISNLWPVKDENDAARVQEALMPLRAVSDVMSVLLVHHLRKSDGNEATASRGSGALPAFADTLMELRRYSPGDRKDRRRVLAGYGRWEQTPDELVVELAEDGLGYAACGDRADASFADLQSVIAGLLPGEAPGATREEIIAEWPAEVAPGKSRMLKALHKGVELGIWAVEGTGRRGSPHTYWHRPPTPFEDSVSVPTLYSREPKTESEAGRGGRDSADAL